MSPMLTDRGGIDQGALVREKCCRMSQSFQREPVNRRKGVLDIFQPPHDRQEFRECTVNLY